jgi:hypothetical protein
MPAEDMERLAERNEVPARRIGSSWRFSCAALMEWLSGDWKPAGPAVAAPAQTPLTKEDAAEVTGAGVPLGQAGTTPSVSPTPSAAGQDTPVGEAPEERPAEDIFLRGQRVLLGRGEVVVDFGQFYSRSDDQVLTSVGGAVGLARIERQILTTVLVGRVGVFNETELFASTTFQHQDTNQFVGTTNLGSSVRRELGGMNVGVRRTLLRERPGLPDIIATLSGHIPTADQAYAAGGGLVLVKSVDPVVLFANANCLHAFRRDSVNLTNPRTENAFDVSMGYGLALNDTLALSMAVSGTFTGVTVLDNTRFRQPSVFSGRFGLTSWLARGLYIEPSVSFGLTGPGRSFAFGVTLPYAF